MRELGKLTLYLTDPITEAVIADDTGLLTGIIVAAVLVLLLIVIIVIVIVRRKRLDMMVWKWK